MEAMNKNKVVERYQPNKIESKWQKKWEEAKVYSPDMDKVKKPFYNLMMFPYPSAEGMHVGNMYAFTGADIYGRFKRLQGFDVFEPIGLDGFGIHSENYAIKVGRHPKEQAKISENNFYRQLRSTGNGYDWTRTVETYDPDYYKWTQWIFIQLFKKGLAYRKKAAVNFCPSCKTVLADEQVIDARPPATSSTKAKTEQQVVAGEVGRGACERCGTVVEKRDLEQWFFRITKYADRLLESLDHIDWSEKVKIAQRNWIGRSEGATIKFSIFPLRPASRGEREASNFQFSIDVFTTRPDTLFGATYLVLAPEYKHLNELITGEKKEEVNKYIKMAKNKSDQERIAEGRGKTGVFTGVFAINPVNNEKIPIWVADYVISAYGTGAIMAVPAHDERDFEFARKYNLEIREVIKGGDISKEAYTKEGEIINSGEWDGLKYPQDIDKIIQWLEKKGFGKKQFQYHLRDWLISRQRYWGPPIPMIYCEKCGVNPVKEEDLPVLLPDVEDWRPEGTHSTSHSTLRDEPSGSDSKSSGQAAKAPLANHPEFYDVACPECGSAARRETDVSDTFLDSSWYFFRYISTEFKDKAFDEERVKKWLPVDMYIGGAEHSVLHLLYTRFLTMVFKDLGLIDFEEPFTKFRAHGLIIAEGAKMSKSKGNIVNPDKYIKEFGADTLRIYLMFMGPFKDGGDFRDGAIGGMYRFLTRVWQTQHMIDNNEMGDEEKRIVNRTVRKVTGDLENLRYNTAISSLMELINFIYRKERVSKETIKMLLIMLSPFAPHITEELYQNVILRSETTKDLDSSLAKPDQNDKAFVSIHQQSWPLFDKKYLVENEVTVVVQVNGRVRDTLQVESGKLKVESWIKEQAKGSEKVKKHLEGKKILKVIYVEGKIINFVTEE